MKKQNYNFIIKILFILILFVVINVSGYGQLWIEDFDNSNTTNPISTSLPCNGSISGVAGSAYYGIVCEDGGGCSSEISAANTASYTSLMGNFLGARDTDNANGSCGGDDEFAEWIGINIASCNLPNKLYLCFDIAEGDEDPGMGYWDKPSFVKFAVEIDNGGLNRLGGIEQTNDPVTNNSTNKYASFDLDCNGGTNNGNANGDGVYFLTATFTNYCFQIPGFGSSLDIRIDIDGLNEYGEDVAIDNVGVYCEDDINNLPGILLVACGVCGADNDCDGLIFSEECDDNDPNNTATNAGDFDCDGVATAIDCDDMDPLVGVSLTNAECNDGDCSNGEEEWDEVNCECITTNIPDPSTCIDDGDCTNGEETWNSSTCECEQLNIPDPSTCVDDGDCLNG
ncbi:MAG: hypothetical protein AB8H03_24720, partial [Saprospiraceae bacterium]